MATREHWQKWQDEIRAIGVTNPLVHFEVNSFGQIDLEKSHPGGFSQFVTSRRTLLSNLVRDPLAFSRALSSARRIKAKADRIETQFGIQTLHLVGGLANFEADNFDLNIPILMWQISLHKKGEDYEITMADGPRVNPALVEALQNSYGIALNEGELLARQNESSDLVPVTVLNYLANLCAEKANLDLKRILVISNFTTVSSEILADANGESNALIDAITGEQNSGLAEIEIPELNLVVDADATQMRIVSRALAGQSFAVETLPGCGYIQTVVNVLAELVSANRRVLVVAPRQQTLQELSDRLSNIGLAGLGARADSTWVDAVSAISRNEKAQPESLAAFITERTSAEQELDKYFDALNATDEVLGVSVARVLRELSKLSVLARPALTSARIDFDKLLQHVDRSSALEALNEAHDLGEFKFGPQDTAWFGSEFASQEEIESAVAIAKKLSADSFPALERQLGEFISSVNFQPAQTIEDWGTYLHLFVGVRDTLDRFANEVFDRPLTELISATAPRKGEERNQMSGSNRRRLKKLAKEYLRPGMHVNDMHTALKSIQSQREQWQKFCTLPQTPQVPLGINDALAAFKSFLADLALLERHVDKGSQEAKLTSLSILELRQKLSSLATDVEILHSHFDRSQVSSKLNEMGLGGLARDLAKLHTTKEHLALELDQAWWQSALESVVQRDSSALSYSPKQIHGNELRFRAAFDEQINAGARVLSAKLADRWKNALSENPVEAESLKALLKSRRASFAELNAVSPKIWPSLLPVVLVSPFHVANELKSDSGFDCVLILDAAGTTLAENIPSLKRAKQVLAFGDDATSAPEGFEIESRPTPLGRELEVASIFDDVRRAFGVEVLRHSYRNISGPLGDLLNREFYQNRIEFTPTAADYQGANSFKLELVEGENRAKTTIEGATESLDAELNHVVEMIFNHATWQPQQSLLVASASSVHAERIRGAVKAGLQSRPNLVEFFESHGSEKFEATSISELSHRIADRVIFSIGFGRTSHGAVLSNFGQLSQVHGRRYLANLLVSARSSITVVSCFDADDVPSDRLSNGAALLKDLLTATKADVSNGANLSDPMLADLSLRLKKLGARVDETFSNQLPLVASFAKSSAVIEPDWSIPGQNKTEKFRIRPGLLTALGWQYIRVYSFELFSDPQSVAIRIAEQLGMQVTKRAQPLFGDLDRSLDDSDSAWGERATSNDWQLRQDKPPHWG